MTWLNRSILVLLFDLLAACAAWFGTYILRFNFEWPVEYAAQIGLGMLVLLPVHGIVCRRAGLYRGMWVFASLPDLARVLRAVAISSLSVWAFVALYRAQPAVPRSTLLLYPILLAVIMAGGRVAYRMWKEHRLYGGLIAKGRPVVIVGAGRGGAMLVRELQRSADWRVVGLVDDDESKWGRELLGLPVLGSVEELPEILASERVQHVILAMPSAATRVRRHATDLAVRAGAKVFTVPGLEDVMGGRVAVASIRRADIEDLLGREPVWIDTPHVEAMLHGKVVLVTGAGGSIGGELCRQLSRFSPARVVLFEQNEFALYTIEQWFAQNCPELAVVPLAGDVKDATRLDEVFAAWRPQVVFHAAAYKHVPLMEVGNAWQAVRNNVLGTLRVAEAAQRHAAERFVLISTDKAVNPTNVMGASKRLAELLCQAMQDRSGSTQFEMVRFGNVLGSTGSVIPKFQEQIARGGPVTVTHPEINRYFMSIPEAAQLVLQAASMGRGGEIFVLDMGQPVKIVDLARNMIRLSGFSEDEIRIEFTGLRPGEKLYEELLADAEETRETPHPKLRIARARPAVVSLLAELNAWLTQSGSLTDDEVRRGLLRWVPEYVPMYGRPALRVVEGERSFVRAGSKA
ncbi:NDP-sugar epimerase, includes UDP-GlcNAc-inverting 4,6-dehydratase FlaA1 and capsular polysaccharide biosynthesis protein EpsC [Aromatoleum tolulyticum]|uniref:NDP-sugar epimerase, includes UDP-GlcNAc-inverting 4,6-dehydratase FlaA1 and capsular polysaccharide biosynthesis protein EpsC n=1 Tax=Aromatoleum tolulyticum TaxID=34027 RepID=A0A1N6UUS8_9RHOO|nr:nucleoside-diphosphate sugar epimerase/dehydratase [Aromatoleum tolulyticum]SIQ69367.1 NDP-sugar epimerase, includes UDP-GlcNAc-inverting 4,6-dehydratase FlaA1 and capsular polysaccharide biosynthesis protein EpsC [Aromatoleum tolulyticum]